MAVLLVIMFLIAFILVLLLGLYILLAWVLYELHKPQKPMERRSHPKN